METLNRTARIGDILTQYGLATPEDIKRALEFAPTKNLRLGEALVRLGVIDEDKLTWALGIHFDLSYVDLDESMIDWDFLAGFDLPTLKRLILLPMGQVEGTVRAVVADPTVQGLGVAAERLFEGRPTELQLASAKEISKLLDEAERRRRGQEIKMADERMTGVAAKCLAPLESGEADSLLVFPHPLIPGACLTQTLPCGHREAEPISELEFQALWREVTGDPPRAFSNSTVFFPFKPCFSASQGKPARAVALVGPAGRLIAVESVPAPVPSGPPTRILAIAGRQPGAIKEALYAEIATIFGGFAPSASNVFISLEEHIESFSDGVFQAEIPEFSQRLEAMRRLLSSAQPRAMAIEVETAGDLSRVLPARGGGTLLVLVREPSQADFFRWIPAGMAGVFMPDDLAGAREHMNKLLNLGVA